MYRQRYYDKDNNSMLSVNIPKLPTKYDMETKAKQIKYIYFMVKEVETCPHLRSEVK